MIEREVVKVMTNRDAERKKMQEKMEVLEAKLVKMEVLEKMEGLEAELEKKNMTGLAINCCEVKLNQGFNQSLVAAPKGLQIIFSFAHNILSSLAGKY